MTAIAVVVGTAGGAAIQRASGAAPSIAIISSSVLQQAWFNNVSSLGSCLLPSAPTDGEIVEVVDEDGTATLYGITVNGNGKNIVAYAAGVATYAFSNANGYGARSTLRLTWSTAANFWKVMG